MKEILARITIGSAAHRSIQIASALKNDDSGQDAVEYALVFSVLALGSVASLASLSELIANLFTHIATAFSPPAPLR